MKVSFALVLRFHTYSISSFLIKRSENRLCLIVWVSDCHRLPCSGNSIQKCFYLSSDGILLSPVNRVFNPLITALAVNFPDHIQHFYFSPVKGKTWILFFFHIDISCIFSYFIVRYFPEGLVFMCHFKLYLKASITSVILLIFIRWKFCSVF